MSEASETSRPGSAEVFRPGVRALVWIVVGISTIATLVAILWGQRLAQPVPGTRDSYARGPLGSRALFETLQAVGMHVVRQRRPDLDSVRAPLIFLEPDRLEAVVDGEHHELEDVLAARARGSLTSIVVLPKWTWDSGFGRPTASPDPEAGRVLDVALHGATLKNEGELDGHMRSVRASGTLGTYHLRLPYPQWIDDASGEVLVGSGTHALVVRRDDGVIVVSDPDLGHNWNLHRGDHARLWVDLMRRAGATDTVALDEVFHGHGERRSLASALGEPPTVLLTGHALFLLLLIVWVGSRRFGPPRGHSSSGKGPAESIAVSAFVLAEGRPLSTLTRSYVEELISDLAERFGLAPGRPLAEQAAHVDRIASHRGEPASARALAERAQILAQQPANQKDALALARAAHALHARLLSRT